MSIKPSEYKLDCDADSCTRSLRDPSKYDLEVKATQKYGWSLIEVGDTEIWACPEHRGDVESIV